MTGIWSGFAGFVAPDASGGFTIEAPLSPGGFCIVDDYQAVKACEQAVTDYRAEHGVSADIVDIDGTGVLWRK